MQTVEIDKIAADPGDSVKSAGECDRGERYQSSHDVT